MILSAAQLPPTLWVAAHTSRLGIFNKIVVNFEKVELVRLSSISAGGRGKREEKRRPEDRLQYTIAVRGCQKTLRDVFLF
jgi:hypothetical protein